MPDKVLLTAIGADALFLATGAIQLGFCLVARGIRDDTPRSGQEATRNLLYQRLPLTAGIANAALILITFAFTLPGLASQGRAWLKMGGYMVTLCGVFSLCLGVFLWVSTLRVKETFAPVYLDLEDSVQSLMQTSFDCCGYFNSSSPAFITDSTCPSPAAAALLRGCATSISSFSNILLDTIFTTVFGMVGVDAVFILCIASLLKVRKENERFRHMDEKGGYSTF